MNSSDRTAVIPLQEYLELIAIRDSLLEENKDKILVIDYRPCTSWKLIASE